MIILICHFRVLSSTTVALLLGVALALPAKCIVSLITCRAEWHLKAKTKNFSEIQLIYTVFELSVVKLLVYSGNIFIVLIHFSFQYFISIVFLYHLFYLFLILLYLFISLCIHFFIYLFTYY